MSEKINVRLQLVAIQRGSDVISTIVPEHEVEVLRAVNGPANVRIEDPHVDDREMDASAEGELLRLQQSYRRINAPDPVRLAFPTGARDLAGYGFGASAAREVPMSVQKNHKAKPAAKPASDKAGK